MTTVPDILQKLQNVRRIGDGHTARCPAHEDHRNSLSIGEGRGGRALLYCHAGCSFESVARALGLKLSPPTDTVELGEPLDVYNYDDGRGRLVYQVCRFYPKEFRPRVPKPGGGFVYRLNGTPRVLYRLSELIEADPSLMVFIAEGERDVDNLRAEGALATCNVGGAGKWRDKYSQVLRGRDVVILPDNDEPGRSHALKVAKSLHGVASRVRILELPGLPEKGDVSDWLRGGGTLAQLYELVEAAPAFSPDGGDAPPLRFARMSDVQAEEVRWLLKPYIPLGKLTMLEGDPGFGKSWLTCALAAAVTRGADVPGLGKFERGTVLMLSAEDGLADTLRPRLDAVGADVSRVFALAEPLTLNTAGLLKLEAAIIEYAPRLVTFDPIFGFTGGEVDIHRANEARAISAPLAAIAERHGCAILAVRHLGKSRGGGHALNAGIGSIDFTAAARSVLLVGADPDEPAKRAIVQIKNNLAPHGEAIGYKLEGGQFFWTGASDLTAGRILAPRVEDEERGSITEAVDYLRTALSKGARDAKAIEDESKQGGINPATLRRAKARLKVRSKKVGMPGTHFQKWVWELPEGEGAQTESEGAQENRIEHLRANGADKGDYGNELAEGAQVSEFEHLQAGGAITPPEDFVVEPLIRR